MQFDTAIDSAAFRQSGELVHADLVDRSGERNGTQCRR